MGQVPAWDNAGQAWTPAGGGSNGPLHVNVTGLGWPLLHLEVDVELGLILVALLAANAHGLKQPQAKDLPQTLLRHVLVVDVPFLQVSPRLSTTLNELSGPQALTEG